MVETDDQKFARLFKTLKEAYRAGYSQALKDVGNEFSKYCNDGRPCDVCFCAAEVLEAVKDFWEKTAKVKKKQRNN